MNRFVQAPRRSLDFVRGNGISQRADAADANLDCVAPGQRRNSSRRSGGDDIAGFERHDLRDEADYSIKGKNHLRGVSRLFPHAIDEHFHGYVRRIDVSFEQRSERANRVKAFPP
jgi:hypothetical protein